MDLNRLNSGKKLISDLLKSNKVKPLGSRSGSDLEKNPHNINSRPKK